MVRSMEAQFHISHSRLLQKIQGARLEQREREHLAACKDCSLTLNWMQTLNGMRGVEDSAEPPLAIIDSAIEIATPSRSRRLLEHVQALLTFDSFTAPLPAGIRPGHSDSRQLVYKGWLLEVTLQISHGTPGSISVTGQLTLEPDKEALPHAHVSLISDREKHETFSDDSGQFLFESVPAREYGCEIRHNDIVMNIDRIPISPDKKS